MMSAVWNAAEPLEVNTGSQFIRAVTKSNSGRKEIEKPPCGEETEGQESRSRRGRQSGG